MDMSSYFLKGRLTDKQQKAMIGATKFRRGRGAGDEKGKQKAINLQLFGRHDTFIEYLIPWMKQHIKDLEHRNIIEIGGGTGSSALAFSPFCKSVLSIDIDDKAIEAFEIRKQVFGAENISAVLSTPKDVIKNVKRYWKSGDIIVLIAVVEHLLEHERQDYLSAHWQMMQPGDYMVIAGTPNRFAYTDIHSTKLPFGHMLSNEVFFDYLHKKKDHKIRLAGAILGEFDRNGLNAGITKRYRAGMGASYHDFENAFSTNLNSIVISDGYDPFIKDWHRFQIDDQLLVTYFSERQIDEPVGFTRCVLNFIFQKPLSSEHSSMQIDRNSRRNQEILDKYSLRSIISHLRQRINTKA